MFDLKVVIIGGGIGGCTSGLFLIREGHYDVHLYERAEKILPVGAAISVWSNGVKVLNRCGLGKRVIELGGRMDRMVYKDSTTNETLVNMDLIPLYQDVGERGYPVPRAELQDMLMAEYVAAGGKVSLGKICTAVEENSVGKIRAVFSDGTKSDYCDLLIGADGIKSTVREFVLNRTVPIVYHYTNWNGMVAMDSQIGKSNEWLMYVGEGKRASVMPVGGNRFYFFMGAPLPENNAPKRDEGMKDELRSIFKGWPSAIQTLIDAIDVSKLNRIPICDIDPISQFYKGNVVLLGDSAHATTPTLGQGGCQAMEDAEVLCSFLTTTNVSVQDALQRYQDHRIERVHTMVLKARERSKQIYPTNAEEFKKTENWYKVLPNSGPGIIQGISTNLKQGPWPPRL